MVSYNLLMSVLGREVRMEDVVSTSSLLNASTPCCRTPVGVEFKGLVSCRTPVGVG